MVAKEADSSIPSTTTPVNVKYLQDEVGAANTFQVSQVASTKKTDVYSKGTTTVLCCGVTSDQWDNSVEVFVMMVPYSCEGA